MHSLELLRARSPYLVHRIGGMIVLRYLNGRKQQTIFCNFEFSLNFQNMDKIARFLLKSYRKQNFIVI